MQACNPSVIMAAIIALEEELIQYLLHSTTNGPSLDAIRQQYIFLSHDILQDLDDRFKLFLIDFFYTEDLPAYSLFIRNDGANHHSEFILHNLERSLRPAVFEKLLAMAAGKAPPYIPLIRFWRKKNFFPLPLFPLFYWKRENSQNDFIQFLHAEFPEYVLPSTLSYTENIGAGLLNRT